MGQARCFDPRSRAGSDYCEYVFPIEPREFRSTLPRGERRFRRRRFPLALQVSIHAPARGATQLSGDELSGVSCFDPRSRAGSDKITNRPGILHGCFDPRSRAGSDADAVSASRSIWLFRSTLPRGERPARAEKRLFLGRVSIHAPARGATTVMTNGVLPNGFRSTLPRGERRTTSGVPMRVLSFDPRSRAGSDNILFRYLCLR